MPLLLAVQAAQEGGGTRIDVGVIGLVLLVVIGTVIYIRRRR